MYINATGHYIPSLRIPNSYFKDINGLDDEWITRRTGIRTRSRCPEGEDQNSMAFIAVERAAAASPFPLAEIDLIISASYTINDTVATVGHETQHRFGIAGAKVMHLTSACSSFVNALETVQCFFDAGRASKALIVSSEQNSRYANESDPGSGHLWGDGAVACILSRERQSGSDHEILSIHTMGLADVGKGPDGVRLRPLDGGISMPFGRDVFVNACHYMVEGLDRTLEAAGLTRQDLNAIFCHQANKRIVSQIAHTLGLPDETFINNIEELGNTGSASCAIDFSQHEKDLPKGALAALTVFGGGYSCGAALIRI